MKTAEDRIKLFLLHSLLLSRLPLKYRAHTLKGHLLTKFCEGKDGQSQYNFNEVSMTKRLRIL